MLDVDKVHLLTIASMPPVQLDPSNASVSEKRAHRGCTPLGALRDAYIRAQEPRVVSV